MQDAKLTTLGTATRVVAFAIVLVSLFAVTSSAATDNWRLLIKSVACVQGPVVTLGEIAEPLEGTDERTWATLSRVKLWKASERKGRPVTVDRDKLSRVLKHYMGEQVRNLVLPSQLTVQTGGYVVSGPELKRKVVAFLTPRAQAMGGDIEFKQLRIPNHFFFPNTFDKLQIELSEPFKPGRNQLRFKRMSSDGRMLSSKAGSVFANVWKAVPVASKPLNRMEHVTRDDISFRRVNLAYKQDVWDGKGGPWRMARTLGRGQPFTSSHLEPVPVIEKGEFVTLVYRNNRVRLSIKAEALDEAAMGEQVPVQNLQSKKTVLATVVGNDTVLVR